MNFWLRANVGHVGHIEFSSYDTCCDAAFYFYDSDVEETVIIDPINKDMMWDRDYIKYIIETCGKHMSIQNSFYIDDMIDEIDRG